MSYLDQLFSLQDRLVVITGAGGALAGSLAQAYLQAGARVALWVHRTEACAPLQEKFSPLATNGQLFVTVADTNDANQVDKAFVATRNALGLPNVLVNAAGGNQGKSPFTDLDLDQFDRVLKLNLLAGLVVPTRHFTRIWTAEGVRGCSVLNIASMGSFVPLSGVWAYNAAKAAVLNLTVGLAKEFGPVGIRVNALAPGFFVGQQNRALLYQEDGQLSARGQNILSRTPFGRFGALEECQGAALFLSSDKAAGFITGVTLPVDGGFLADNI
ncbi:MAG: SDR family oxidoreductase [Spirochaetales bacterium]|nr:SDR family oxidoreductase [Spirochaetales bacterium]